MSTPGLTLASRPYCLRRDEGIRLICAEEEDHIVRQRLMIDSMGMRESQQKNRRSPAPPLDFQMSFKVWCDIY